MNVEQIISEMKKIDAVASDHNYTLTQIEQMLSEIASEARYFGNQKAGMDLIYTANSAIKLCNQAQHSFDSVKNGTRDYICRLKR